MFCKPFYRLVGLMLLLSAVQVDARETLRVLAWAGYADPDLVAEFERQQNVNVEVSIVGSDDELWQKVSKNKAQNFDVFAVNTAELQRYIDKGLSQPLILGDIPNTKMQLRRFRNLAAIPGLLRGGMPYAIPYTYSEMGLIYNRKLVKQAPTSMNAMWDPAYQGKVLAFNGSTHNFSLTALALGMADPFQLGAPAFTQVVNRLRELRRNLFGLYNLPEEAVQLFRENQIALIYGNYGSQQVQLLRRAGADIGYVIPAEGALAWLDCWAMTSGAKNRALAAAWINYTLTPKVSGQLPIRQGLANTIDASSSTYAREDDRLIWLRPVEDAKKRSLFWERIHSGYRSGHF